MATNIQMELKSLSKKEKKTSAGLQQITFACILQGSTGNVQATLTLKADDVKELNAIVTQMMGNQVILSIESAFREKEKI